MISSEPVISIVIPTFNRAEALTDSLLAILKQSLREFEVIVVDNGPSTDASAQKVQGFLKGDERFKYMITKPKGDFIARNIGCQQAQADLILTIDDDWEMTDPETLAYIVGCFNQDEKLGVLGISEYYPDGKAKGQVVSCASFRDWPDVLRETTLYSPGKINRWGLVGAKLYYLPLGKKHTVDHVRSSCLAFRRKIAEEFGYFPTFYVINADGYRSETELCCQFRRRGYKVIFSTEIQGLHKSWPRDPTVVSRQPTAEFLYTTGRNNTLFFLRNYWSPLISPIFFIWDLLVGNSSQPGLIRFFSSQQYLNHKGNLSASLKGKWRGFREYWAGYYDLNKTR